MSHTESSLPLVLQRDKSPVGAVVVSEGTFAEINPWKFSTRYFDSETGIGKWPRRDYDPALNRWLSKDPIGEDGGPMLYLFVFNNSVGEVDALGFEVSIKTVDAFNRKTHCSVETFKTPEQKLGDPYIGGSNLWGDWQDLKERGASCRTALTEVNNVISAKVDGHTTLSKLYNYLVADVVSAQLSGSIMSDTEICGCCDSAIAIVTASLQAAANITASGRVDGTAMAKAVVGSIGGFVKPNDPPLDAATSLVYTLPIGGGCVPGPDFRVAIGWNDYDTKGKGVFASASIGISVTCAN